MADRFTVLRTNAELRARIAELAGEISKDYEGRVTEEHPLLLLCTLRGAVFFAADLARCLTVPAELNFIKVHTYVGMESKLEPAFELGENIPVAGQQVLILEDIVDTGRTMDCVVRHYYESGAESVEICTMLDKHKARAEGYEKVVPKYTGFKIENLFVVGFGLDYDEKFRLLPDVCVYHPDSAQQ